MDDMAAAEQIFQSFWWFGAVALLVTAIWMAWADNLE